MTQRQVEVVTAQAVFDAAVDRLATRNSGTVRNALAIAQLVLSEYETAHDVEFVAVPRELTGDD